MMRETSIEVSLKSRPRRTRRRFRDTGGDLSRFWIRTGPSGSEVPALPHTRIQATSRRLLSEFGRPTVLVKATWTLATISADDFDAFYEGRHEAYGPDPP